MTDRLLSVDPHVWCFMGDSVTQGARHTHGRRDYTEIIAERVRWELGRFDDVILNLGVSGATVEDCAEKYAAQLERFRPDTVSLMFGVNDAKLGDSGLGRFHEVYRNLVKDLRDRCRVRVVLHTPNPVFGEQSRVTRVALPRYVEVVRKLAAAEGIQLVDNFSLWDSADESGLMDDDIHPNGNGHLVIARAFLIEVGLWDSRSELAAEAGL